MVPAADFWKQEKTLCKHDGNRLKAWSAKDNSVVKNR